MEKFDSVATQNDYVPAAKISEVFNSNGGFFSVQNADVFAQLQYGRQGQFFWTPEVHVPQGNGTILPGTTGIQFRSYIAGSPSTVSAALSAEAEPTVVIGAGGNATTAVTSLANFSSVLASDVVMTLANTYYTGPVIATVPPGTWLFTGTVTCRDGVNGNAHFSVALYDGATAWANTETYVNYGGTNDEMYSISVSRIVPVTVSSSFSLIVAATVAACRISAAPVNNPLGSTASVLNAVQIA